VTNVVSREFSSVTLEMDRIMTIKSMALDQEALAFYMQSQYTQQMVERVLRRLEEVPVNREHKYGPIGKVSKAWLDPQGNIWTDVIIFPVSGMVEQDARREQEQTWKDIRNFKYTQLSTTFRVDVDPLKIDEQGRLRHPASVSNFIVTELSLTERAARPVPKYTEIAFSGIPPPHPLDPLFASFSYFGGSGKRFLAHPQSTSPSPPSWAFGLFMCLNLLHFHLQQKPH